MLLSLLSEVLQLTHAKKAFTVKQTALLVLIIEMLKLILILNKNFKI